MSTKSQSLFSKVVVSSISMFTGRFFLLVCIKVDSYKCMPIAFFSLRSIAVWFVFYYISCYVFVCQMYPKNFSTFPVLISSNNSFGKFSPVKLTFCVFSFIKNIFFEILKIQTRHVSK